MFEFFEDRFRFRTFEHSQKGNTSFTSSFHNPRVVWDDGTTRWPYHQNEHETQDQGLILKGFPFLKNELISPWIQSWNVDLPLRLGDQFDESIKSM